jgi:hypothetical protein
MGAVNRRNKKRSTLDPLGIAGFMTLDHMSLISRSGRIVDASANALLVEVAHADLVPKMLRDTLSLEMLVGDRVMFTIPHMNLELSGTVTRTKLIGKKTHEIAIDFSAEAPEYWREALFEMLPRPGELQAEDDA